MVASLWGIYTFVWKDILVPRWAPASLVIEVTAQPGRQRAGAENRQAPLSFPIQFQVTATNPTQRALYLLPGVWWAEGVERQETAKGSSFETAANEELFQPTLMHAERGKKFVSRGVLAIGRLFPDEQILPGEKLSRDFSITMPGTASGVAFQLILPALTRNPKSGSGQTSRLFGGRTMSWAYSEQAGRVFPLLCPKPVRSDGAPQCQPLEENALEMVMRRFDPGAVTFLKTKMLFN